MVNVGATWVRFDVKWSEVQREGEGSWDWAPYDALVDAARERGLYVLANLAYSPPWARPPDASDKHGPDTDERRAAFGRFVGTAVERYRDRVRHWEVWNEPNNPVFWTPEPDAAAYVALLRVAHRAAKDADRRATVLAGATSPAGLDGGGIDEVDFLARAYAAGARGHFDAWSHHPYDFARPPGGAHDDSGWWQMYGTSPSLRSLMREHGDGGKALWATEHGVPSGGYGALDEGAQAAYLRGAYALWRELPWAGPIFNYLIRDRSSPGNDAHWGTLGLLREDWSEKPAADAVPLLADADEERRRDRR